jgi:hypothetical protein
LHDVVPALATQCTAEAWRGMAEHLAWFSLHCVCLVPGRPPIGAKRRRRPGTDRVWLRSAGHRARNRHTPNWADGAILPLVRGQ